MELSKGVRMQPGRHLPNKDYPVGMYVAYTKSVCVAMEWRLMDLKPARPYVYWRWFREELEIAAYRMAHVSGEVKRISTVKED